MKLSDLDTRFRLRPWASNEHREQVIKTYGSLLALGDDDSVKRYLDTYRRKEEEDIEAENKQKEFFESIQESMGVDPVPFVPSVRLPWDPEKSGKKTSSAKKTKTLKEKIESEEEEEEEEDEKKKK